MQVGKWILTEAGRSSDGHTLYTALCSKCGYEHSATKLSNLKRTAFNECKHPIMRGWPTQRLGKTYHNMLSRCHDEKAKDYKKYGGRGIYVCEEWRQDPANFIRWAVNTGYNDTMTIDRIDSTKGYSPDNCRWLSAEDNSKYKRTTRVLTVYGTRDSLTGWAKRLCVPATTLFEQVRGKTDEEAVELIKKKIIG